MLACDSQGQLNAQKDMYMACWEALNVWILTKMRRRQVGAKETTLPHHLALPVVKY